MKYYTKLIFTCLSIVVLFTSSLNAKLIIKDSETKNIIEKKRGVEKKLSIQKEIKSGLKRYGIDYFQTVNKIDLTKIITPDNYLLNVGDSLEIKTFGLTNKELKFNIDKEGNIIFPIYGPLKVSGIKFKKAKEIISDVIIQIYPNSNSTIHISKYASITTSISGEVKLPGVYNLSPFSTLVDLVIKAGGIKEIASLRTIYLIRDGKKQTIDLYKVINGQISFEKLILKSGDFIYIPTATKLISIDGAVKLKGIYELRKNENFKKILSYSQGLLPQANKNAISLKRYVDNSSVKIMPISFNNKKDIKLYDGDYILIDALSFTDISKVIISGQVNNPGEYKTNFKNNTLKRIIEKTGGFTEKADKNRILITSFKVENGSKIFKRKFVKYDENILLNPFDKVQVFELKNWNNQIEVTIKGCIMYPGTYTLKKGEKINVILELAGGYSESANYEGSYINRKRLAKIQKEILGENIQRLQSSIVVLSASSIANSNEEKKLTLLNLKKDLELLKQNRNNLNSSIALNLSKVYQDTKENIILENNDEIVVPMLTNTVQVVGEVMYPSTFIYEKGKDFTYYIRRSAGFTNNADLSKAYVRRVNKEAEILTKNSVIKTGDIIMIPTKISTKVSK